MIGITTARLRELFGSSVVDCDTRDPDRMWALSTTGWESWPGRIDQIAGVNRMCSNEPMVWAWAGYDLITGEWSFLCAECDNSYCVHCFALVDFPDDPDCNEEILEAVEEAAMALGLA